MPCSGAVFCSLILSQLDLIKILDPSKRLRLEICKLIAGENKLVSNNGNYVCFCTFKLWRSTSRTTRVLGYATYAYLPLVWLWSAKLIYRVWSVRYAPQYAAQNALYTGNHRTLHNVWRWWNFQTRHPRGSWYFARHLI